MPDFVHLHVHSCFSMQDGAADLGRLVSRAAELDMPALALTDHEGLYGAVRFYQACRGAGIKPIVGAELTLEGNHHLVLLAQDRQGYANLCRLISQAHLAHRDEAPQLAWQDLAAHSQHLIALSGCARGEVPSLLFSGAREEALAAVQKYVELFGRDRFYLELQNHLADEYSPRRVGALADLARQAKVNTVATNNVHYVEKSHYKAQDVLICIKHIISVNEPHPERKPNAEYYLKSPQEMQELFRDHPQAVRNALRLADQCRLELDLDSYHFPHFDLLGGETAYSYLCKLCFAGARRLYRPLRPEVMQRLQRELDLIQELGFAEYFLVVWDIVNFARKRGIRCSGRGSAGDSLVCHVLRLTDADPMAHANLIFERFLSREHSKMPDIDVDFCSRRRDEVVDYIYRKYGQDHVAAVCTLNTFRARSAIRAVGKALGLDPVEIDRFAKALPYTEADNVREALRSVPETRDAHLSTEGKQDLLDICALLNGFPHHLSVHVGGLVISRQPLRELVPVEWAAKGIVVAQFDKDDIEALGLVKMDILGLRMHTAVSDCLEYIERGRSEKLDLESVPLDDEKTFELIRSTNTIGVFQIESPGQRNLLGRSQPRNFEDLITEISLFRPGPVQSDMITPYLKRLHGQEPVTYLHPALEPILAVTRGVLIYQEQVLQIAHALAGFTLGQADQLRRAMTGDRSSERMLALREDFIKGCLQNGVKLEVAEKVWEEVSAFASFGFCKAHACCFAKIAYQTAYLKARYPAEFLAGVLSAQPMGFYPARVILEEAKRCGLQILPPDINRSEARYTVEEGKIRVGLGHLKCMSEKALASILEARQQRPFRSLRDFCERTRVPKPITENLILAGAFAEFDPSPTRLLWELAALPQSLAKGSLSGKVNPELDFDLMECLREDLPDFAEVSPAERTKYDLDLLGVSTDRHPMTFLRERLTRCGVLRTNRLRQFRDGDQVRVAGIVVSRNRPPTRSGQTVVFITIEDEVGVAEVVIFPRVYDKYGYTIYSCPGLIIEGKLSRQGKLDVTVIAERIAGLGGDPRPPPDDNGPSAPLRASDRPELSWRQDVRFGEGWARQEVVL